MFAEFLAGRRAEQAKTPNARRSAPRTRAAQTLAALAVASLFLAACQTGGTPQDQAATEQAVTLPPLSSLTPAENPRELEGPTTAVIGGPSIDPIDMPAQALPVTVTSLDPEGDQEVDVTDASRVIALSLSGSVGDAIYSLGLADTLVGRDVSTQFPGSEDIPLVTKAGHSIDAESTLALEPTLIITDGSIGPTDVVLQLRDAGVQVVTVERAIDAESSYAAIQRIADALGAGEAAPELISHIEEQIATVEGEVQRLVPADEAKVPRVAFLYVRGTAGIFYLFGEGSGVDSLIRSVGAVDVAAEVGWAGERPMTEEALVEMNPDVLLVMTDGLESAGGVDGLLEAQPSIALTNAGQHRRIIDVDDAVLFAGGSRIPDVIDGLARAIYAPASLVEGE